MSKVARRAAKVRMGQLRFEPRRFKDRFGKKPSQARECARRLHQRILRLVKMGTLLGP